MTAIWAPSATEGQILRRPRSAPAPAGLAGRQVVDEELAISWTRAIRRLSGLNLAEDPETMPGSFRATDGAVDVPDRQGTAGIDVVVAR